MVSFTPNIPEAQAPSYIGYSQAISPFALRTDRSQELAYSGAGQILGDVAKGTDNTIKAVIDNALNTGVDQQREGYTGALEQIAGIPSANRVADYQPDNANTAGSILPPSQMTAPPAVQAAVGQAGNLVSASANGKLTPTYYTGRLDMLAKDVRSQFPGYTDYIDQQIAQKTGGNPANEYMRQLLTQINTGIQNNMTEKEKNLSYVRDNSGIPGAAAIAAGVQNGTIGTPQVIQWASGYKGIEAKAAVMKANFDMNNYDYQTGNRIATTNINTLGADVIQHNMVTLGSSLGGSMPFSQTGQMLSKVASGDITLSESDATKLAQSFSAYGDSVYNQIKSQALASGAGKYMKPEELDSAIKAQVAPIYSIAQHLTNKEYGPAYQDANFLRSNIDQVAKNLQTSSNQVISKYFNLSAAVNKYGGPNAGIKLVQDAVADGLGPALRSTSDYIKLDIAAQNDPNHQPVTMSQWITNLQNGGVGVGTDPGKKSERGVYDTITNLPGNVAKDKTIPDALKTNVFNGTYGPGNQDMISKFAKDSFDSSGKLIPGQNYIFSKLTNPQVADEAWRLGQSNPQVWQNYKNWTTGTFSQLFGQSIRDLNNINPTQPDNSGVKFNYNSDTHHFGVSFTYPNGAPTTQDKVAEQGYKAQIAFINSGLDSMSAIAKREGTDVNALALRLVAQENGQVGPNGSVPYQQGITDKIFNAVKAAGQKIKSQLDNGQRPDQILGGMLPAGAKIFSSPSLGDYKVEQLDNNDTALHGVVKQAESGGNYDALYGTNSKVPLSNMTVGEVMALQKHYVDSGSPSSAAGAYQFLRPTLAALVRSGAVKPDEPFDKNTQDRLATALMEKRGLSDFKSGKITKEQFLDNLSKEWAGLPTTSGQSYYEGDGLNHSTVRVPKVFAAMAGL